MNDLIRPFFSFDFDDLFTFLGTLTLGFLWFRAQRAAKKSVTRTETVDASVLNQFLQLTDRITALEVRLEAATIGWEEARLELREVKKLEVFLEGKVHEREKQIAHLTERLEQARERIRHLEDVCKRAGINGEVS